MLEDELSVLIYILTYPVAVIFNMAMDFIGTFLNVFLSLFTCIIGIINAFNTALHAMICIALPPSIAVIVLIMFYILGFYYLIKLIKMLWDVLPFA